MSKIEVREPNLSLMIICQKIIVGGWGLDINNMRKEVEIKFKFLNGAPAYIYTEEKQHFLQSFLLFLFFILFYLITCVKLVEMEPT